MAMSQTFTKYCSTSGPTCSNSINSCSTSGSNCSNYTYCETFINYKDYYEHYDYARCNVSYGGYMDSYDDLDDNPPSIGYLNEGGYNDYARCSTSCNNLSYKEYYNYSDAYSNYSNYKDSNNYCNTKWSYYNYINANSTATKLGQAYTPVWSTITPTKFSRSLSEFSKELRDNVRQLSTSKNRNQVSDANVQASSGTASDTKLAQNAEIDDSSIANIRTTLLNLYSELNQTAPSLEGITENNEITYSSIKALKEAVDNLAKKDISGSYVNYLDSSYNNSAATYVNMSNIPNSIITTYINNADYTDYSETTSYID